MAVAQGLFLAVALLFVSLRLHCSSPLPGCPEPCSCQGASLLNCSSSGLSLVPQHILDSVTELDLSHNLLDSVTLGQPHHNLRNVWLGNNSITHFSLCIERNPGGRYGRSINPYHLRPWSRHRCVSWAPSLQLLSVERNQLERLPKGLEGSESLQVLQLSFNRISTLQPGDLSRLRQLIELRLQHNLITSLHPQMFQGLAQLQVLDLRFNKLTSLHPLMYLSLHNIGADVRLDGNRWQCDCSMRSLRRRMAYDSGRGLQAWSVVCASPSILSGRELLQLEEDDLSCISAENRPELHQDVTVYSGSEILLSCSAQDSMWWTPSGQASASQTQAGLLINDISERDTGLYVCVSEEHDIVSVFNLQISKIEGAKRKIRSLTRTSQQIIPQGPPDRIGQERNQRAIQSNLVLAVCLSVFITFLIAFILGVLARPCIDILWRRVTSKKSSSETSVSPAEQRQYDNEAYCTGGEPEATGTQRERRVTFNAVDFRENSNVQYYDTVASGDESNNQYAVIEYEAVAFEKDTHTAVDSGSENSFQQSRPEETQKDGRDLSGVSNAGHKHNIEYEHIPDPVELDKRSLSSCSDSSLSDKVRNEDQMTWRGHITTKSPQVAEDSLQQRADFSTASKVVQISAEGSEIAGFSSEPFADWSPHTMNPGRTDPDQSQENEEQFEFSDSDKSFSPRSSSVCGFFNDSKLTMAPTSYKKSNDMSSSSSYISEDEPTEYTVNSDKEEEEEGRERSHNKGEDYTVTRKLSDKGDMPSSRIVTGEWETKKKVEPMPRTKWRVPSLGVTSHSESLDTVAPLTSAAHSSSSSSESEAEITDLKVELNTGRVNEGIKIREPVTLSTDLRHQYISQMDIDAPLPATDSTSSDESVDETRRPTMRQHRGDIDMAGLPVSHSVKHEALNPQWPPNLDHITPNKRHSDSSSSSESSDETIDQNEKQGEKHTTRFKFQKSVSQVPEKQWPALDLEHTMQIRRRLDIKAPSPRPDSSSSSDSDNETPNHASKQEQGQMHMAMLPNELSQTPSNDPETGWPALNLEHTTHIKRELDTKGPSPDSDSSSSSDSEDKTRNNIKKLEQREAYIPRIPIKVSQTVSDDPPTQWPALDLEHTTRIKRRLDIKASSPPPDSSSSSESDNETPTNISKQDQGQAHMARLPNKVSQTVRHDSPTQRPALDLEHTAHINRHLDITAPSPDSDSSSSSDSEDETTGHIKKQKPGKVDIAGLPFQESKTGRRDSDKTWPTVNLEDTTRIKRRLDIKAPSPDSDSSSSSDSEDGTTNNIKKREQKEAYMPKLSIKVSQTVSDDPPTQWPALDLEHTTRIKRRLDIKASSPPPDSSSSSESDNETPNHISKQDQGQMHMARLPNKVPQTVRHDSPTQRPALDLKHTAHINRHLDITAPSPDSDSSSSSDSEDETTGHIKKQKPGKVDTAGLPFQGSLTGRRDSDKTWPTVNLEDTTRIKRRLDIKAPSPDSGSSSSSDSEDGTTNNIKKREQKEAYMPKLSIKVSQTVSDDPPTQWPALDLEHTTRIKRRLDIKASSPAPDSSSSSESDNETPNHISKQDQGQMHMARLPNKVPQTVRHDSPTQRPALDLKHTAHINRHLDITAPSPDSDSSSSSDSEDETTGHIKKQKPGKVDTAGLPFQESKTRRRDSDKTWPTVNLEDTTRIKRRLDIKAPSPESDSSSSSDSEDGTTNNIKKQEQKEAYMPKLSIKVSQTVSDDPPTQWPALDLEHTTRIKRRLDLKAPSPTAASSSSSDSDDKTKRQNKRPELVGIAGLPFKESQRANHNPETWWSEVDLSNITHIKRRLEVKAPLPPPDSLLSSGSTNHTAEGKRKEVIKVSSSSSSSDEQEEGMEELSNPPTTVEPDPDSRWPQLGLSNAPHVKRRLDIRACSPESSSSSNESDVGTTAQPSKIERDRTDVGKWSMHVPYVNRRQNTKAPTSQPDLIHSCVSPGFQQSESNSSASESENENRDHAKQRPGISALSKETEKKFIRSSKISVIHTSHRPKTDHGIKLEKYTFISDNVEGKATSDNINTTSKANPELESRWAMMNLGISRFRKRLEITSRTNEPRNLPSSSPTDSLSFSSSDEGTGSKDGRTRRNRKRDGMQGIIYTRSSLSPEDKSEPPFSLKTEDNNSGITERVKDRFRKDYSLHKTEEKSNPDTMLTDFGAPYSKRNLDVTDSEKAPGTPPLRKLSDSSSSSWSETEDASTEHVGKGWRGRSQLPVVTDEEASQIQASLYVGQAVDTKLQRSQSQTEEVERIAAGIEHKTSSSDSSEDETIEHSVPDLSLGVPRVKRRLNVTAPSPGPSSSPSSCSKNENEVTEYTAKQSRHVSDITDDDSVITYKRLIFRPSAQLSNSFSSYTGAETVTVSQEGPSHSVQSRNASLAPGMSFDDVVKKRMEQSRRSTDMDLPSKTKWTGISHQMSDLSISGMKRNLDVHQAPPVKPQLPPLDSSNNSSAKNDDKIKQDRGKAEWTLMHKNSNLSANSVSFASGRTLDKSNNSASGTNEILWSVPEDRRERKGLSALKTLSSDRRRWDTQAENLDQGASPLFDYYGPQVHTSFNDQRSVEDIKPLAKQPLTQLHLSSSSVDKSRATHFLHDIPRYRRQDVGGIKLPQEAPPPIPTTLPPDEAEELTWRSPRSSDKQGLEANSHYLQQSRSTTESDPSSTMSQNLAVYLDSSNINISHV